MSPTLPNRIHEVKGKQSRQQLITQTCFYILSNYCQYQETALRTVAFSRLKTDCRIHLNFLQLPSLYDCRLVTKLTQYIRGNVQMMVW